MESKSYQEIDIEKSKQSGPYGKIISTRDAEDNFPVDYIYSVECSNCNNLNTHIGSLSDPRGAQRRCNRCFCNYTLV